MRNYLNNILVLYHVIAVEFPEEHNTLLIFNEVGIENGKMILALQFFMMALQNLFSSVPCYI